MLTLMKRSISREEMMSHFIALSLEIMKNYNVTMVYVGVSKRGK